jgi:hypothetical protein
MSFRIRPRQKSPFFLQRVRYLLSRLHGARLQKDKSLHFVTLNGQRFKRLVLCDSRLASRIARNLEQFSGTGHFPEPVTCYERELWVEFVDGERVSTVDEAFVEKAADFYATLYTRKPLAVAAAESGFPQHLYRDLRFLHQIGLIDDASYRRLDAIARALTPQQLWVGFEYTDPVLKNFVISQETGRLCAIDVDGLASDELIGIGVMKGQVRWLEPFRALFLERLLRLGAPDFNSYLPFLELCFLARWTKRSVFEHKWKAVDPSLFTRFLDRNRSRLSSTR